MHLAYDDVLGLLVCNTVVKPVQLDELLLRLDEMLVAALDLLQPRLVVQIEVLGEIFHPRVLRESGPPVHLRPGKVGRALGVDRLAEDAEVQFGLHEVILRRRLVSVHQPVVAQRGETDCLAAVILHEFVVGILVVWVDLQTGVVREEYLDVLLVFNGLASYVLKQDFLRLRLVGRITSDELRQMHLINPIDVQIVEQKVECLRLRTESVIQHINEELQQVFRVHHSCLVLRINLLELTDQLDDSIKLVEGFQVYHGRLSHVCALGSLTHRLSARIFRMSSQK